MKNLILLIATIVFCNKIQSQTYPSLRLVTVEESIDESYDEVSGDYIKDSENLLDPYIGTWKYEGNGSIYIIKIRKIEKFATVSRNGEYSLSDRLLVTYKFVKDGITLVDNLSEPLISTFHNISNDVGKKYGIYNFTVSLNYITGRIKDIPLNISTSSDIYPVNPVNGTFNKIKIQYNGFNSYRGNPAEFYMGKPTFMLPNFVELIRQ